MIAGRTAQPSSTTTYRIDASDVIVDVGGDWTAFARKNDPGWRSDSVIGRNLYEFIDGRETCTLYEALVARVRIEGRSARFVYRCDAPDLRRHMEMTITPLPRGEVEFHSRVIREEPRAAQAVFEGDAVRSADVLVVCSSCKLVQTDEHRWNEIESVVTRMHLDGAERLPAIRNGMCPRCRDSLEILSPGDSETPPAEL
jgi:hypothetical protein